jgi:hypothetical protein
VNSKIPQNKTPLSFSPLLSFFLQNATFGFYKPNAFFRLCKNSLSFLLPTFFLQNATFVCPKPALSFVSPTLYKTPLPFFLQNATTNASPLSLSFSCISPFSNYIYLSASVCFVANFRHLTLNTRPRPFFSPKIIAKNGKIS